MSSDVPGGDPLALSDTVVSAPRREPAATAVPSGQRVGRYRIERPLGSGGMASVFLAVDDAGQRVALKLMNAALKDQPDFVARFANEARATASLRHRNIVSVFDAGEADGQYFMATEFVDGGTVADLLAKLRELPPALAAEVVLQVLEGLDHAHSRGIVHRDLKPENLLISSGGVVKIADFGIARVVASDTRLTSTGMLIGTVGYMSPEQARGVKVDPRSDLFSLGIILYELLTGRNPFASENPATSLAKIMANAATPIAAVRPTVPAPLERLIDLLLQLDPAARLASAKAAVEALTPFVSERRRTQPRLLEECLQRPLELKQLLGTQAAEGLVAEARADLGGDAAARARASLKLYAALTSDPSHAEARRLFEALMKDQSFSFGPAKNPKLQELERAISQQFDDAPSLLQASQLAKLEGNPLKASIFLRLYLRVRPDDAYAAQQFKQLTGEAVAPRGPSTAELLAGVPKGGLGAQKGPTAVRTAVRPAVAGRAETSPSLQSVLPGLQEAETVNPLPGLISKALWVGFLLVALIAGYRWLSRSIDSEAKAVMVEDAQRAKEIERRAQEMVAPRLPPESPAPAP